VLLVVTAVSLVYELLKRLNYGFIKNMSKKVSQDKIFYIRLGWGGDKAIRIV
jgi:hypothetical protein